MQSDCFKYVVGLSNRDCDCHFTGRPAAGTEDWHTETFILSAGANTVTSEYDLPETPAAANLQVFKNNELIDLITDYTVVGNAISLTAADGDFLQIFYRTSIPATDAYKESKSGLFITDLLPEEELTGLAGCDETLWDLIESARTNAVREFRAALNATLQRRNHPRFHTFAGNIGKAEAEGGPLVTDKRFAGLHIRTNGLKSGYLKINRMLAMFTGSGSVNVTILDQYGVIACPAFSIQTKANRQSINAVDVKLPLQDSAYHEQHYYIIFEYDANNKPLMNKTVCASCAKFSPSRDTENPVFAERRDKHAWANYLVIGGWEGDSIEAFTEEPAEVSEYMNGLSLEVEIGCDVNQGLCGILTGFDSNPWAASIAAAIQRKAAVTLLQKRLASSKANRLNSVNQDALRDQMGRWEAEYAEIITYISNNIPQDVNECLECTQRVKMASILG
jgi:hypothetical protein